MIKELVIHLGDTKTGSTSIQNALVRGVCQVPGKTLFYPTRSNHVALAKTLTKKHRVDQRADRFNRLKTAFMNSDADIGIVSAEHFQFVDPNVLNEAIEAHWPMFRDRLRLVAYVRPHADKLVSTYSERVKLGGAVKGGIEAFFDTNSAINVFRYAERFGRWRTVFGDRFILRPFVRSELYQGDAISDFLRTILGQEDFEITGEIEANTSLTLAQLALMREMHKVLNAAIKSRKAPAYSEARAAVGRLTGEYIRRHKLGRNSTKLAIPRSMADAVRARYGADAAAVDAAFFTGTPMTDALAGLDRKLVDQPQSLEARDHFGPKVIQATRIFAHVLSDMVQIDPEATRASIGKARATDAGGAGKTHGGEKRKSAAKGKEQA